MLKKDPLVSSGFVCNVRKGKNKGVCTNLDAFLRYDMRFGAICLVEQTEQKFCRYESVLKKTSDCNSRALLIIKAPTKKRLKNNEAHAKHDG